MKKRSFVFALAITAIVSGAVLAGAHDDAATLSQISNYRQWTPINGEPVKVEILKTETDPISLASAETLV